jgi:hypothetical protein
MPAIPPSVLPVLMLFASNVFMTFAWFSRTWKPATSACRTRNLCMTLLYLALFGMTFQPGRVLTNPGFAPKGVGCCAATKMALCSEGGRLAGRLRQFW